MTEIQYCKNCKYLDHDGMFGIFCAVGGNNKNHDCPKYEEKGEGMTEKDKRITFAEYCNFLLKLPCPMDYEFWSYLHSIVEEEKELKE